MTLDMNDPLSIKTAIEGVIDPIRDGVEERYGSSYYWDNNVRGAKVLSLEEGFWVVSKNKHPYFLIANYTDLELIGGFETLKGISKNVRSSSYDLPDLPGVDVLFNIHLREPDHMYAFKARTTLGFDGNPIDTVDYREVNDAEMNNLDDLAIAIAANHERGRLEGRYLLDMLISGSDAMDQIIGTPKKLAFIHEAVSGEQFYEQLRQNPDVYIDLINQGGFRRVGILKKMGKRFETVISYVNLGVHDNMGKIKAAADSIVEHLSNRSYNFTLIVPPGERQLGWETAKEYGYTVRDVFDRKEKPAEIPVSDR
jgi:hypothetical protein